MTYICVHTEEFELLDFDAEVVFELAFRCEEFRIVAIIESQLIFGQRFY